MRALSRTAPPRRRSAWVALALWLGGCTAPDKDDDDDDDAGDSGGTPDTAADPDPDPDTDGGGGDGTELTMVTSLGTIVFDLDAETAPITTANFLSYAEAGFFDGADGQGATVIHRVAPGFVVQGGGYTASGVEKVTQAPIPLETDVGLSNLRGTVAMARTDVPDSATSQFFVNLADNTFLDHQDASNAGYAVFGEVRAGMDVVDAMAAVPTSGEVPLEPIVIESVQVR